MTGTRFTVSIHGTRNRFAVSINLIRSRFAPGIYRIRTCFAVSIHRIRNCFAISTGLIDDSFDGIAIMTGNRFTAVCHIQRRIVVCRHVCIRCVYGSFCRASGIPARRKMEGIVHIGQRDMEWRRPRQNTVVNAVRKKDRDSNEAQERYFCYMMQKVFYFHVGSRLF